MSECWESRDVIDYFKRNNVQPHLSPRQQQNPQRQQPLQLYRPLPTTAEPVPSTTAGRTEVSRSPFYDCDGSGHGYNEIVYSDGSIEYEEF